MQARVDRHCAVLADYFPVGKYIPGLSIVDESCVFFDAERREIACYDRRARTSSISDACCEALLEHLRNTPAPKHDDLRHPRTGRPQPISNYDGKYLAEWDRRGVRHLAWAWEALSPGQGLIQSVHMRETYTQKTWVRTLVPALAPLYSQAAAVVHARDTKCFNLCVRAMQKACKVSGGRMPLKSTPFNGTALIFLEDTSDHIDARNLPGAYGVCQPLGTYPVGEGVMTLVQLGIIVLYRPVDTLSADYQAIVHYTRPITRGFRYCLTHFMHRGVYDHALGEGVDLREGELQQQWELQKESEMIKRVAKRARLGD